MATQTQVTGTSGARRRFVHRADPNNVVTDGYMSLEDATTAFINMMREWGFSSSDENLRGEVAGFVAQTLRQGTSYERDWNKVYFDFKGVRCEGSVLRNEAGKYDTSENPVKVWARSYNSGEIPVRISDMLLDPMNVEFREMACLDYMASMDMAHLCFDTADALVRYKGTKLTQSERVFIKAATNSKVRESRSMFIGSSDGGAASSMSGNAIAAKSPVGAATPIVTGNNMQSSSYSARSGFANMRS